MKFVVLVCAKPEHFQGEMAYRFVEAALQKDHHVSVFFYGNGVYHAQSHSNLWQQLTPTSSLQLMICSGSAQRRGIWLSETSFPFTLSGLAVFMELLMHADKVLHFNE